MLCAGIHASIWNFWFCRHQRNFMCKFNRVKFCYTEWETISYIALNSLRTYYENLALLKFQILMSTNHKFSKFDLSEIIEVYRMCMRSVHCFLFSSITSLQNNTTFSYSIMCATMQRERANSIYLLLWYLNTSKNFASALILSIQRAVTMNWV